MVVKMKLLQFFLDTQMPWQSKTFVGTSKFIAIMSEINVINCKSLFYTSK